MDPVEFLFLSQEEIVAVGLKMKDVIAIVEGAFAEHGLSHYENPPKPGIHTRPDAFIHAMPAYLPRKAVAGMKWVSGYSRNPQVGLPSIMGVIVLNDVDTGQPLAILEAGIITALRTAAVSGVAAKYLARPDAECIGIVGAGVQGRYNLLALEEVLSGIKTVKVYDTHLPTLRSYVEAFSDRLPFAVLPADSAEDAIREADVVVTATGQLKEVIYHAAWVKAGALVLPVHTFGWEPAIISAADKFVVDDWAQFSAYINSHGRLYAPLPLPYAEVGQIVIGKKPGRAGSSERIIDFNLGIAIHDMAVATEVLASAQKMGLGTKLTLMREPPPFIL